LSTPGQEAADEVRWAEFPQRSCRQPFTEDGLIDKTCDLPELHPGPDASKASQSSADRRLAWQRDNPGWEKLAVHDDPFEDITAKLQERP
jgi:hypothetical protein